MVCIGRCNAICNGRCSFSILFRKKKFDDNSVTETKLARVMGLLDIVAIGVSSTLGSGIYVLAGNVITNYSGPAIIFSFIIAGIGLCYAELGARVPRSGSAYIYIYVTIGELIGFIMGWDLILEYIIGTASTANALSQYIDRISDKKISTTLKAYVPMNINGLGPYPDFLAFGFCVLVTLMMIVGVKESSTANRAITVFNILVLVFIIIAGAVRSNGDNWSLNVQNVSWNVSDNATQTCSNSDKCGHGGYAPFGFSGIIMGAAKCFYAYIGFDAIASTGEEVVNPKRNIPLSIIITLVVVSVLYCGVSAVLTLMIPYYLLDPDTPLPVAFEYVHLDWAKYVVSIGAIGSLSACLYAGMFPMPRIVYSMANDGLIFKFFAFVLPKLHTPYVASIITGLFAGVLACIFDLGQLVDMLSIGTMMAYTLVSICVLLLRYKPENSMMRSKNAKKNTKLTLKKFKKILFCSCFRGDNESFFKTLFFPSSKVSNLRSSVLVTFLTFIAVAFIVALNCILQFAPDLTKSYFIFLICLFGIIILLSAFIIWRQPQVTNITTFKIYFVPFLPLLSVFVNIYMMLTLSAATWLRFVIWFVVGLCVYYFYGFRCSGENFNRKNQNCLIPCYQRAEYEPNDKDETDENDMNNINSTNQLTSNSIFYPEKKFPTIDEDAVPAYQQVMSEREKNDSNKKYDETIQKEHTNESFYL